MKQTLLCLLGSVSLLGCSVEREHAPQVKQAAVPAAEPPVVEAAALSGEEAYKITCARCHNTGLNGAPITSNPADWENRSPLWQAVLVEHAKDGYLGMPAKGGSSNLPDMTVSAAAEYMLEVTFPNLPPD